MILVRIKCPVSEDCEVLVPCVVVGAGVTGLAWPLAGSKTLCLSSVHSRVVGTFASCVALPARPCLEAQGGDF